MHAHFDPQPVLYSRATAARVLDVSTATIIRLERQGRLTPIKLAGSMNPATHFRREEVLDLANGQDQ